MKSPLGLMTSKNFVSSVKPLRTLWLNPKMQNEIASWIVDIKKLSALRETFAYFAVKPKMQNEIASWIDDIKKLCALRETFAPFAVKPKDAK